MSSDTSTHTKSPLRVIIVGAGVAGLATAYGLKDLPGVTVRILEKRQESECAGGGYPIHLAPEGREALGKLLSSTDYRKLLACRNAFPASHDGITIMNSSAKVAWRMVKSPGQKCLMERQALIDILRQGVNTATSSDVGALVESLDRSDDVDKPDEHSVKSLRVDTDEMPDRAELTKRDTFGRAVQPNTVKNIDVDLAVARSPGTDPFKALHVEYGRSVKDIAKSGSSWILMLSGAQEVVECDLLIGADGMFSAVRRSLYPHVPRHTEDGNQALPYSIVNMRCSTAGVRRWIGDEDGLNLIYGKGWSAACLALTRSTHLSQGGLPDLEVKNVQEGTYVALTIPHPRSSLRDAIASLPDARDPKSLIHAILADPGVEQARAFPLWTSRETVVGSNRAVLIGDASHGMVPFCGAGASAGLADAVGVVELLHEHIFFGGHLEYLLDQFSARQKERNDPLIKQSRTVLWLVQGESWMKRVIRSTAFGALELGESLSKQRRMADAELKRWKGK